MRFLFERKKLVIEPSGASALAALLAGRWIDGARAGGVLSGGNIVADVRVARRPARLTRGEHIAEHRQRLAVGCPGAAAYPTTTPSPPGPGGRARTGAAP